MAVGFAVLGGGARGTRVRTRVAAPQRQSEEQPLVAKAATFLFKEAIQRFDEANFNNLDIRIGANSSWDLLQGKCEGVEVSSDRFKFRSLQADKLRVQTGDIEVNAGNLLRKDPLVFSDDIHGHFEITFRDRDLIEGSFVREVVADLVKELILTGIADSVGQWFPLNLNKIEFTVGDVFIQQESLLVFVYANLEDGTRLPLRIDTKFNLSRGGQVISFKRPKLVVQLPFSKRTVAIPFQIVSKVGVYLGPDLSIQKLYIINGAMYVEAEGKLRRNILTSELPSAPATNGLQDRVLREASENIDN